MACLSAESYPLRDVSEVSLRKEWHAHGMLMYKLNEPSCAIRMKTRTGEGEGVIPVTTACSECHRGCIKPPILVL